MLKTYITLLIVTGMLMFSSDAYAQGGPPSGGPPDPPDTPIDGGIGILLALGVGYGIKKIKDKKQL